MSHLDNLEAFQRCWDRYARTLAESRTLVSTPPTIPGHSIQVSLAELPEQVRRAFMADAEGVLRKVIEGFYENERAKLVDMAVREAEQTLAHYGQKECPPES